MEAGGTAKPYRQALFPSPLSTAWPPGSTLQGARAPPKKSKNLHKHSCGFAAIRIDHGHQRSRPIRLRQRWAISSVGRAPRLHRGCREFESLIAHHFFLSSVKYQSNATGSQTEARPFSITIFKAAFVICPLSKAPPRQLPSKAVTPSKRSTLAAKPPPIRRMDAGRPKWEYSSPESLRA
ncbi:hypothetical conserved protein [Rhizobium etli CFN 42]|uniref:Hypothetical conserved protein n=1 Tax=Rhizobium etli (strain ATCC 51251 / DSM 11541 / JCM 21823 / NBRC 15573 / CFN 42) TaxID=347834 RepID=Q2K9T6_RHIEC|nr:hypothetical conserved protein [Rhizobium etli CFN 42]